MRKKKLFERVPNALHIVFGPRIDALGRSLDRYFAALANGNVNDMHDTPIPSINTQLQQIRRE